MDVDAALKDLGQFGKFQRLYFTLILFPVMMCGFRYTEYIFTTLDIPHRCRVPECEVTSGPVEYSPPWLNTAVPMTKDGVPDVCQRYQPVQNGSDSNFTSCHAGLFNTSIIEKCSGWVFAEPARTVTHDFDILCPEDSWKRTLLSSLSVCTSFVGLPFTGFLSDRFGRKCILVYGATSIAISGIIRSFSINYVMLAGFEMVDGLIIGALYEPAFLLGLENLSSSKRQLGSMIISVYFALGQVVLACLVWWAQDWRLLQRVFYTPLLSVVFLHWLLTESVCWLFVNKRFDEAITVLKRIASMNKTEDKLPDIIKDIKNIEREDKSNSEDSTNKMPIFKALSSRIILRRFLTCTICRILCLFTYYGLSQNSIQAKQSGGNRYLSFLLVSLAELPGYVASLWVPGVTILGRRGAAAGSFFIIGITCLALFYISHDRQLIFLILSLVAKFSSTLGITVIYLYTAELFPTEARHSLISVTVTLGSIGFIAAQQLPLLVNYIDPIFIYGTSSILGATIILTGPETMNEKLPDTVQEAEAIGIKVKSQGQT